MANNNENKVLNVPHLRFPEFTEEWVNVSLKDVADFQKERISSGLLDESTYISTENILQNFQGVQSAISIPANTNVVAYKKNDILLSNIRPYLKKAWFSDRIGGCSADVFVLRSKTCEPEFLYNVIASDKFINYVMSGAKGVKMPRGDKNQMESFSFSIPAVVEQRKISRLFQLLDERIVTQNKIIEDLKKLKSAISERLFNAIKGDVVVLEDIGDVVKGKQINGEFLSESGKYYVMNGGIEPSGFYNDYNVEANTISISEGGNSCGYVQFNACPFWSGGHCYTIQNTTDNVKTEYLYQFLKSKESEIMKLRIGSGLPNIQKKDLAKFKITIPNISEQKVISAFLSSFERKADVEMNFVNLLLEEKQYLLRQMFI
ncbi:restriction endonuclease subunit S [Bacteroides caccae]|uniref:restriction endonuclease subunit S n=1 Tax=Bacteroides caccae TaxID=47678 RepID=UPI001E302AB6|nr:restriction endonuclease subunit S [Bacteroides caccae]